MIYRRLNVKIIGSLLVMVAIIPIAITAFQVIATDQKSVIFLDNYHPGVVKVIIIFYILLMALGLYWLIKQIIYILQLKKEKSNAELMLLKNQVNPHFFFNILNNLYGLISKDPELARELVLKLSDMMRYSIYEGAKDKVPIQDEIDFLKNYIELHKMRYQKCISVEFTCDEDCKKNIAPLLFIILLENAFKHGVEKLRDNAYIRIDVTCSRKQIMFTIENNYIKAKNTHGIGLKNLMRRLELLYPDQHQLTFKITDSVYLANLILKENDSIFDY